MNNDYLIHYGVKGQKWGVKRFESNSTEPKEKKLYNVTDTVKDISIKKAEQIKKGAYIIAKISKGLKLIPVVRLYELGKSGMKKRINTTKMIVNKSPAKKAYMVSKKNIKSHKNAISAIANMPGAGAVHETTKIVKKAMK